MAVDMGLGKTLQSICILASKHFERAERYKEAESPDAVHLPSLIVCPPTLTGHWFHEVQKYAENLKPVLYVGNARERAKLARSLKNFDVVITSYEVVRNDIDSLQRLALLHPGRGAHHQEREDEVDEGRQVGSRQPPADLVGDAHSEQRPRAVEPVRLPYAWIPRHGTVLQREVQQADPV
jgi:hypothetical protein